MSSNPFSGLVDQAPLPADLGDALSQTSDRRGSLGSAVWYWPRIHSTNDVAARLVQSGQAREGAMVLADTQTAGRGRRGRSWFSPPGAGLYVSVVLTPERASASGRATSLLTLAAGVGIAEGVQEATGLEIELKWPNDLYVGRRKVGGILAEAVRQPSAPQPGEALLNRAVGHVILGYGINIRSVLWPPELAERATALETEVGRPVDRASVFGATLCGLARRYRDLVDGRFDAILDAWRRRAPRANGARIAWIDRGERRSGMTVGLDTDGALRVETDGGIERIVAGEIEWL